MPVRSTATPDREGAHLAILFTAMAVGVIAYVAMRLDVVVEMAGPWLPLVAVPAAALATVLAGLLAAKPYGLRRTPGTDALLTVCVVMGMCAGYSVRAEAGVAEVLAGNHQILFAVPREIWLFAGLEALGLILVAWLFSDVMLRGRRCVLCGEHCKSYRRAALVPARGGELDRRMVDERQWGAFRRKGAAGWLRFDLRSCRCKGTVTLDVFRGRWGRRAVSRDQRLSSDDMRTIRELGRVMNKAKHIRQQTPDPAPATFVRLGKRPPSSAFR